MWKDRVSRRERVKEKTHVLIKQQQGERFANAKVKEDDWYGRGRVGGGQQGENWW